VTGKGLLGVSAAGTLLAAICCATPALAIQLSALGLSAWLAWSDYVALPMLLVFLGITAYALIRRRQASTAACRRDQASHKEEIDDRV
jgi:mercuric ion transport protein